MDVRIALAVGHLGGSSMRRRLFSMSCATLPPLLQHARALLLRMEYDGTCFTGSKWNRDGRTLQGVLQQVVRKMTGEAHIKTQISSRLDKGVHSKALPVLLHTTSAQPPFEFQIELNRLLPKDVVCLDVRPVTNPHFDPRLDALTKWYRYSCLCGQVRPALERQAVWHVPQRLDVEAMRVAATYFVGRPMDFSALRSRGCSARNPICTIESIVITSCAGDVDDAPSDWRGDAGELFNTPWNGAAAGNTGSGSISSTSSTSRHQRVIFDIVGNRFLRKMVRSIAGSLVAVGRGTLAPTKLARLLAAGTEHSGLPSRAPAQGLCLQQVKYHEGVYSQEAPAQPAPGSTVIIVSGRYAGQRGVVTGGREGFVQVQAEDAGRLNVHLRHVSEQGVS